VSQAPDPPSGRAFWYWPALVVLALGLGATALYTRYEMSDASQFAQQDFEDDCLQVSSNVVIRLRDEADTLKQSFVVTMSHEFRTPLSVILNVTELLEDFYERLAPSKRTAYFQTIRAEIFHLSSMVQDLLMQGELNAGSVQAQLQPTDVVRLCGQTLARVAAAYPAHPAIQWDGDEPGPLTLADGKLLDRALSNLLCNALKYSPGLTPVGLSVRRVEAEWIIQIQDQGLGIPAAEVAGLTTAFRRGSNVGSIKGTGVGLFITKACVELQGGRLELRSQLGQGSTFSLHLPWRPAASVACSGAGAT